MKERRTATAKGISLRIGWLTALSGAALVAGCSGPAAPGGTSPAGSGPGGVPPALPTATCTTAPASGYPQLGTPGCLSHATWSDGRGHPYDSADAIGVVSDGPGKGFLVCIGDSGCLTGGDIDIEFSVPALAVGHYDDSTGVFAQFYEPGLLETSGNPGTSFSVDIDGNDGTQIWGRFSGSVCELGVNECALTTTYENGTFAGVISGDAPGGAPKP